MPNSTRRDFFKLLTGFALMPKAANPAPATRPRRCIGWDPESRRLLKAARLMREKGLICDQELKTFDHAVYREALAAGRLPYFHELA